MNNSITTQRIRNSNIELLRLILMAMVILLHLSNRTIGGVFDYVKDSPILNFILYFLNSLSVGAVNCFMIISGYFLYSNKRINFSKVADILTIVVFYRFIDYFMEILFFDKNFSFKHILVLLLPMNYFAIFYVVSYILSPFISYIFRNIENRKADILILILLSIFIMIPSLLDIADDLSVKISKPLSPISTIGNGGGYTIVQFIVMLSMGMWIRKRSFDFSMQFIIILYAISSLIMTVFVERFPSLYYYCSLFTVINAVCLFLIFNKIHIQNNFINYCSKSCFAIFCIHIGSCANILWKKYCITAEHFTNNLIHTILWTVLSVFIMFVICLLLSIMFRLVFGKIKERICAVLPSLYIIEE